MHWIVCRGGNLIIETGYCDHQPSSIQVRITDSGAGLEEIISKIFNPFYNQGDGKRIGTCNQQENCG